MSFHEIQFPTEISRGATGGPERRTDVVVLGSGHEERNAQWADARRNYNAGYGVRSIDDLHTVIEFFEERRGQLYGFRWKDHADFKSTAPGNPVSAFDQLVATGDDTTAEFQLSKVYGGLYAPYERLIRKPVVGTVLVAVDGTVQTIGTEFDIDYTTGQFNFTPGYIPASGAAITAGFEFDTPVRFATDRLDINLASFSHGSIPTIPIVEVRV